MCNANNQNYYYLCMKDICKQELFQLLVQGVSIHQIVILDVWWGAYSHAGFHIHEEDCNCMLGTAAAGCSWHMST